MSSKRIILRHMYYASRAFFHNISLNYQLQKIYNVPQVIVPAQISFDVRKLESIWRRFGGNDPLRKELYQCYEQSEELITYATNMIRCACSVSLYPKDIIFKILIVLSDYIRDNDIHFTPLREQKLDVLTIVLNSKDYQLIHLLCKVFKIDEEPLTFKNFIEDLLQEQKIIEVSWDLLKF